MFGYGGPKHQKYNRKACQKSKNFICRTSEAGKRNAKVFALQAGAKLAYLAERYLSKNNTSI